MKIRLDDMVLELDEDLKEFFDEESWRLLGEVEAMMRRSGIPDNDQLAKETASLLARFKTFVRAGLVMETPL